MYQQIILDHYKQKLHSGLREPFNIEVHRVNPVCGDEITLRVSQDGQHVRDISYECNGCAISQAAVSMLADSVIGMEFVGALQLVEKFVEMIQSRGSAVAAETMLGDAIAFASVSRYPARVKCALLGWLAFRDAVGSL